MRILITPWIFLFFCSGVSAQWKFGVEANLNISSQQLYIQDDFNGNTHINGKYILGATGGVDVDYHISNLFFLRSGLFINMKGTKFTYINQSSPDKTLYYNSYTYLECPLYALFKFHQVRTNYFYGGLGPFISYAVHEYFRNEDAKTHQVYAEGVAKIRDENKPFDEGLNFLVGYHFDKKLSVNINYQISWKNISSNSSIKRYDTQVINIGLGYQLF